MSSPQTNIYYKQLDNRNYMSPIGFTFAIARFPKVSFFSNKCTLPPITLGTVEQPSYLKGIPHPGDRVEYGELAIEFLVDEDMLNYSLVHNWITGLGFPESCKEFDEFTRDRDGQKDLKLQYSDATLGILNSNYNEIAKIKFLDIFPTNISPLEFTATDTDINYFTVSATFSYLHYQILDPRNQKLTPDYVEQSLL